MHTPWSDLELFLAVSETGSLTGAAKRLQVTQPTVSRNLADLEARLGEPRFTRAVDGAKLTAFGERLLEPIRRMADSARDAALVVAGAETKPRGVVRVTAPPGVAAELLVPFALRARDELPEVRLEVVATVGYMDLVRREAALAVRLQPLDRAATQRDLVTVESIEHGVAGYATASYIATLPRGYCIADVGWIGWAPPLEHLPPNPQLAALIPDFKPIFAADDYLVQLRAAEAGVGAIILGKLRSRDSLPSALVEMKLELGNLTSSLHLVSARASLAIPRVRAVADLLARDLRAAQGSRSRKR